MVKRDWPRTRKGLNGSGKPAWIVDLRPYGSRKHFRSKDEAVGEAQIQRNRLLNEGLEGVEFTLEQRTDALAAITVLDGSGLSLIQAAKIAVEFHGIQTNPLLVRRYLCSERSEPIKSQWDPTRLGNPHFVHDAIFYERTTG